jgi:DNA polymerase III alpha subunit
MYTNVLIVDSATYPEEYAQRAVELGHGIISSCEHGYQGRYIESFEMAEKYNLKYLFAVEAYFVYNRFEKDNTNAHMVLCAKNENGRKAINRILSEASMTGFYYRPRIDYDLLMTLPKNDVWITTACIGGINRYTSENKKSEMLLQEWKNHPKYETPYEMLVDRIHQKFEDSFYLEVQSHNTIPQAEANAKIIEFSKKYNIEIIAGVDSHYIYENDAWKRDYLQKSSGIFMDDEQGWYMDYPDGATLFQRFKTQKVLTDDEIRIAIDNTNVFLEVEEYTSPIFNHEMKMPSAPKYQNMSEQEKQIALMKIVKDRWDEIKHEIPKEKHEYYMKEIAKELDIIFKIKHADYFLLNYEIIKDAVENRGGMITFSGRGSGPSFYVNHLLGFTQIDRISSPITLYPERFLSTSRMTAGSLADIDFNCGNTPVFVESQKSILGGPHAEFMIAYGKLKPKAAWKMYCRAVDVPFEISNEISSKIDEYESDLKYWDEESGEEEPNVLDYIPEDLQEYFLKSKEFLGLISHGTPHPCGSVLLSQDIREEIGIVRLKSKGGRETICACLDGLWCEKYLMLKNDLLTVTCVRLVYDLYKRVGIPYMSLNKLLEEVKIHPEVWDMYEKGYVVGLNQVERNSTKRKVMKYKPKNISELSAFIAGIRPAFKSLVDKLINREHFEYGIPTLDNLLQTEELPESFILYQEQIMKILAFAGIPMGDCYTVIKSISKKRFEKIMHYKEQFLTGMAQKLIEAEGINESRAEDVANTIWGIIEDASAYGFNSSHSLSVSFDSLLAAYFKALYPLEFYEVYLNLQMEKAKKDKAFLATQEMKESFNIKLLPMRFGQDNRKYTAYPENNSISNCMKSIKGFGDIVGQELFRLSRHTYNTFLDLLIAMEYYVDLYPLEVWNDYISQNDIDENISNEIIKCINYYLKNKDNAEILINKKPVTLNNVFSLSEISDLGEVFSQSKSLWKIKVNETQVETLIMLNYFEQYGRNNKLLEIFKLFNNYYSRKILRKDKILESGIDMNILMKYIGKETEAQYSQIDFKGYINEVSQSIENKFVPLPQQLKFERELMEIPIYQNSEMPKTWNYVLSFKTYGDKINTPYLILYNLNNGEISKCQINKSSLFRDNPFGIYSIIDAKEIEPVFKKKKLDNGKYVLTNETKNILKEYDVVIRDKNAELNEVLKND